MSKSIIFERGTYQLCATGEPVCEKTCLSFKVEVIVQNETTQYVAGVMDGMRQC